MDEVEIFRSCIGCWKYNRYRVFEGYHSSISKRGHIVFKSADDALKKYKNEIDLVVSTGVIEHIDNPQNILKMHIIF